MDIDPKALQGKSGRDSRMKVTLAIFSQFLSNATFRLAACWSHLQHDEGSAPDEVIILSLQGMTLGEKYMTRPISELDVSTWEVRSPAAFPGHHLR